MDQTDIARILTAYFGDRSLFFDWDDVASEVILRYLKAGQLETYSPGALRAFAIKEARRMVGFKRAKGQADGDFHWVEAPQLHIDERVEVLDYLDRCSSSQKDIALLRFGAGFTWAEVGSRLGVSSKTVERDWRGRP